MRILFDKNVPVQLRRYLTGHWVETSANRGWGELKNGILLKTAEVNGFDAMVTADQNIAYQQNLKERTIALVVLGSKPLDNCSPSRSRGCRRNRRGAAWRLCICSNAAAAEI